MAILTLVFAVFFVANFHDTVSAPAVTYDQQQTGDLNVQIDLKDIKIVALLDSDLFEDFGDYDYAYDYSDFTIKPITSPSPTPAVPNSPTSSITPSSIEPWHTWPTIAPSPSPSPAPAVENPSNVTAAEESQLTPAVDSHLQESSEPGNSEPGKKPGSTSPDVLSSASVPAAIPATESQSAIINSSAETPASEASALPIIKPQEDGSLSNDKKDEAVVSSAGSLEPQIDSSSEKKPVSSSPPVAGTNSETLVGDQGQSQPLKKCNPRSTRDQEGRCRRLHTRRRIPSSFLPFGIRLTPRVHNRLRDDQSKTVEN